MTRGMNMEKCSALHAGMLLRANNNKRARRSKMSSNRKLYKAELGIYKSEIKANKVSWIIFCESVEGCHESSKFRCTLGSSPAPLSYLSSEAGNCTMVPRTNLCRGKTQGWHGPFDFLDNRRLTWAINSLKPFKCPGLDGIITA